MADFCAALLAEIPTAVDSLSTIDCAIRDLSPHGARVTVEDQAVPPRAFSLVILDTGRVFDAIRRWQHGQSIGLEFSAEK